MGIVEKRMETTIMGYIRYPKQASNVKEKALQRRVSRQKSPRGFLH